jgi:MFS family permease
VNAYLVAFGGLLLLSGRIGDLIGQRRVFLVRLGVFTGASLLCALSQSQGLLIGARFVQGVGGAPTSAVILGMIVTMFPEPREQTKAIGVYTFVAVAGGSVGLLLGGVLTETINLQRAPWSPNPFPRCPPSRRRPRSESSRSRPTRRPRSRAARRRACEW